MANAPWLRLLPFLLLLAVVLGGLVQLYATAQFPKLNPLYRFAAVCQRACFGVP